MVIMTTKYYFEAPAIGNYVECIMLRNNLTEKFNLFIYSYFNVMSYILIYVSLHQICRTFRFLFELIFYFMFVYWEKNMLQ